MALSKEVRRLATKWGAAGDKWPKRLEYLEIRGIRGWTGQRFQCQFPIMAVVGENGAGKSTVLQAAASVYGAPSKGEKEWHASDFFPDTAWDHVRDASIRFCVREGETIKTSSVRKPTDRWRGNPDRRKRHVDYIDLSRIQPVAGRTGYSKLANGKFREVSAEDFGRNRLQRFGEILGRPYEGARMALSDGDEHRKVPVISQSGAEYSGFHQGAGETTLVELLQADIPKYSLIIIDEIESSLHPRAQRRLIRDLAERCRDSELQIIFSTHSPYVLSELPPEARAYILQLADGTREIIYGVSPEFAMTQMDDVPQSECDLFVEDESAERMLIEILSSYNASIVLRCQTIPYGAASVGQALGKMAEEGRFPRPTAVFLDGDNSPTTGCHLLPGDDAPERVVFEGLQGRGWRGLSERLGRGYAKIADACQRAMTLGDHHDWIENAADQLIIGGSTLWQAMCAEWAQSCLSTEEANEIGHVVEDVLEGIVPVAPQPKAVAVPSPVVPALDQITDEATNLPPITSTNEPEPLF